MKIPEKTGNYQYSFCANIKSPKLRFKQDDFFVKIRGYGRNSKWAEKIKETADLAVCLMRKDTSCENILKIITIGTIKANSYTLDLYKIHNTGILRTKRQGWKSVSDLTKIELHTNYSQTSRYHYYQTKLDNIIKNPLQNPFRDTIELTVPKIKKKNHYLQHAPSKYVNNALELIFNKYKLFKQKYNYNDINISQMNNVNNDIAEIRWILAHATPWSRGSDAIANILMRAMYKSLGIKSYPLKKGISLDLEAYCTNLADYKKNFSGYFVKPSEIID